MQEVGKRNRTGSRNDKIGSEYLSCKILRARLGQVPSDDIQIILPHLRSQASFSTRFPTALYERAKPVLYDPFRCG